MLKNLQIKFTNETSLQLCWDWVNDNSDEIPKCNVFYCGVPEDRLLEKGLFLENEILSYFNEELVKIFSPNAREEMTAYNLRNMESSRMHTFHQGNHFQANNQLTIPSGTQNNIFLVCVFDENDLFFRVVASGSDQEIPFDVETAGFFKKILGGSQRKAVTLRRDDSRKKVVSCMVGGKPVHSVLPQGHTKLYFSEDTDLTTIKIRYLSSLIGKQ